ncbi:MAG: MBL fold metallo-hydrolase [Acidobacteria bacterium]|nr:MBL fold metallo-hydrolase [Acidobacteriota bacterium]
MKRFLSFCLFASLIAAVSITSVQSQSPKRQLEIFYVDVEGGAATLIVTPAGESILVDTGWPGFEGRDAKRIEAGMKAANITQIDHLIITHYHTDHYGGVPELAKRIKIGKFYDHGPMDSLQEDKTFAEKYAAYKAAAGGKTNTLSPGSTIELKQAAGTPKISLQVLAAAGEVMPMKVKASPSKQCDEAKLQDPDPSDNARSVVFVLRYGNFDFLDSGDLTWNIEHKLICPTNLIGEIDLFQIAHHGAETSNSPLLVNAIKPTAAIMNNGPRKGGHPDTVKTAKNTSTIKDLWQVHRNISSTDEQNAPADFVANLEAQNDAANMIRVSVNAAKKSFTVTNDRNKLSKTYAIK